MNFIKSIFVSVLQKLGFMNKEATIVLCGLDNAGKTTLQYKLKTGNMQLFTPTLRAKEEEFTVGGITFKTWDLGGHSAARHLWAKYSVMADGVVFMMDASDKDRLEEARAELHAFLEDEATRDIPLVVLANKCDKRSALARDTLMQSLDIDDSVKLYRTSVLKEMGYLDAFQWLAEQIP